jgi:predicted TIM-barrel fold metal-dependent hydrolase
MDAAEIKQAIILGWYWENANTCYENTSWQRDWIARHPDRLMAFAPFNANGGAASIDALKQAFECGFSGIGELNPPAQGYTYENETLDLAIALAGEYNVPVNFHVTDPTGHDYPGKIETPIDSLIALAKSHAETTFIFAHLAGMMELPQLKTLKNVYLDTAAVPLLYPRGIYQTAIEFIGSDRILFGSDYPLRTFPQTQRKPDFKTHIDSLKSSGISQIDLDNIFDRNIREILPQGRPLPNEATS